MKSCLRLPIEAQVGDSCAQKNFLRGRSPPYCSNQDRLGRILIQCSRARALFQLPRRCNCKFVVELVASASICPFVYNALAACSSNLGCYTTDCQTGVELI